MKTSFNASLRAIYCPCDLLTNMKVMPLNQHKTPLLSLHVIYIMVLVKIVLHESICNSRNGNNCLHWLQKIYNKSSKTANTIGLIELLCRFVTM